MTVIGQAEVEITASVDKFSRSVDSEIEGAGKRATGAAAKIGTAIAGAFAVGKIVDVARESINAASDLSESQSKVNVVFGKSAGIINGYSETSAKAMGISKQAYLEAAGTLGNLLLSVGQTPAKAAEMSASFVKLAGDLASFNNVSPEEAMLALRSGLTGETEPLKKFGINMNEATLKAKAMQLGLSDGKGVLDANAKAQAAYALILDQSKTAQGDFARTSDGLANRQRILAAQVENLKAKVGSYLLPAMLAVTTALTNGLRPVLEWLITSGKKAWAWVESSGILTELKARLDAVWDVLEPVVEAIRKWVEANPWPALAAGIAILTVALIALLAPLVLTAATAVIAAAPFIALALAIGALVGGVVWAYTHFELFRSVIDGWVKFMYGSVLPVVLVVAGFLRDVLGVAISWLVTTVVPMLIAGFQQAWGILEAVGSVVIPVLVTAFETVVAVVSAVAEFVTGTLIPAIVALADWFTTYVVPAIVNFADIFVAIFENIVAVVKVWWPIISAIVSTVLDGIIATVKMFVDIVRAIIEAFVDVVMFLWKHFGDSIMAVIEAAFRFIWGTIEAVFGIIKGIVEGALEFIAGLFHAIASLIRGDWQGLWDGLKEMVKGFGDAVGALVLGIFRWIRDTVGGLVGDLLKVAADLPGKILGAIGDLASKFLHVGESIIDGIINGIKNNIGKIGNAILDVIPGGSMVRSVVKGLPGFDEGGWVDGPPGAPQLAVVHGGEFVVSRAMLAGLGNRIGSAPPVGRGGAGPIVETLIVQIAPTPGMSADDAYAAGQAAAAGAADALAERRLAVATRAI